VKPLWNRRTTLTAITNGADKIYDRIRPGTMGTVIPAATARSRSAIHVRIKERFVDRTGSRGIDLAFEISRSAWRSRLGIEPQGKRQR